MCDELEFKKASGLHHYNQSKRHYNRTKNHTTKTNSVHHARRSIIKSMIKNDADLDLTAMDIDGVKLSKMNHMYAYISKKDYSVHNKIDSYKPVKKFKMITTDDFENIIDNTDSLLNDPTQYMESIPENIYNFTKNKMYVVNYKTIIGRKDTINFWREYQKLNFPKLSTTLKYSYIATAIDDRNQLVMSEYKFVDRVAHCSDVQMGVGKFGQTIMFDYYVDVCLTLTSEMEDRYDRSKYTNVLLPVYRLYVDKGLNAKNMFYFATKAGTLAYINGIDMYKISKSHNVINTSGKNDSKGFVFKNNEGTFRSEHLEDDDDTTYVAGKILRNAMIITDI